MRLNGKSIIFICRKHQMVFKQGWQDAPHLLIAVEAHKDKLNYIDKECPECKNEKG